MQLLREYKKITVPIFILIIICIYLVVYKSTYLKEDQDSLITTEDLIDPEVMNESIPDTEIVMEEIYVDVKGAVVKEGVYVMAQGLRVKDVIDRAGGFLATADSNKVNLAARLMDEMVIYIPEVGEEGIDMTDSINNKNTEGKININTASLEELQSLTGVGPSKAEGIISYREENGPFQKPEDLLNVSGIGNKTLDKFIEQVVVH